MPATWSLRASRTTRRLALVMGALRQNSVGPRTAHGTAWRKRPRRIHCVSGSKGAIEKPDRSCCDLGHRVHVGMLHPILLARGRDEDPVTFTENTQPLADLAAAVDLPPALGPGEADAALRAGHRAKRVEPAPVVAAGVEERGQPFVAINFENEN